MYITNIVQATNVAANNLFGRFINYLPQLFAATFIALSCFVLGRLFKKTLVSLFRGSSLSRFIAGDSDLAKFLKQAEVSLKPEEILGELGKWFIYVLGLIATVNTLGLTTVSEFLMQLLNFVPRIISSLAILCIGIIFAGILEGVVKAALIRINVSTARIVAKITSYTLLIFSSLVAISELGIAETFIRILFTGMIAAFSLAFGLAFGLGAKDLVKKLLEQWYTNFKDHQPE